MSARTHPRNEVLLAATLFLMTRFQSQRCPCVARAIVEHLDLLASQAEGELPDWLRSVCAQLGLDWQAIARGPAQAVAPIRPAAPH